MIKLLLMLAKFAKFGPALKSAAFMLLSVGAYALLFGWRYAVGFVLLMLVHEFGHYYAARRLGLNVGLPTFIPFVGAWIELKDQPLSVAQEAQIAFAGPFAGTVAAVAVLALALSERSALLMALAYVGFFLNLFNLIPIVPLDGGRAAAALHPVFWFVGLLMMVALVVLRPNPILILIVILGGMDLWRRWKERGNASAYYKIPARQRVTVGVVYLGLVLVLALSMSLTHVERTL